MDDLISRKAVQEALCADTEEGTFTFTEDQAEAADKIIRYVVKTLRSVPSVPAVPLDKLCEFLAEMYHCPASGFSSSDRACHPGCSDEMLATLCGTDYENYSDADRWKAFLTKWMEDG